MASMGPSLSPRETRRSGRRSAPSASTSTSKSPQPESAPQPKEKASRPNGTSSNTNGRNRRPKQEDLDDAPGDPKTTPSGPPARHTNTNGRNRRKGKEKDRSSTSVETLSQSTAPKAKSVVSNEEAPAESPEDEEQGVTRCVCGNAEEDDPDAGEFMVQCETCKVWQHGPCMGFETVQELNEDDYYCELCRPDLHQELLKKLSKKTRHTSTSSHHNPISAISRVSRSRSPAHLSKPAKRRNTMNSRDAAFDESLKELIEATAAEAAAAQDARSVDSNANTNGPGEPDEESVQNNRKKRKRTDEDLGSRKRNRSASATSDQPGSAVPPAETQPAAGSNRTTLLSNTTAKGSTGRNRRGGARRQVVHDPPVAADGSEAPPPTVKRQTQGSRSRATGQPKRAPPSAAVHAPSSATHEHGTRRNNTSGVNGATNMPTPTEASRAYRNSHAYAVSQQPMFTSWNLPDYLAHLEAMLPSETPQPLEVRGFGPGAGGKESAEGTLERGVKVKWPSKRMSVGDMNKRVRSLVEWVGREQANALDRGRRREALGKALKEIAKEHGGISFSNGSADANEPRMDVEDIAASSVLTAEITSELSARDNVLRSRVANVERCSGESIPRPSTMKLMEELMEELINFQERFGPGAKVRERRLAAT